MRDLLKWLDHNVREKLPESLNKTVVEPVKKWYCNVTKQN